MRFGNRNARCKFPACDTCRDEVTIAAVVARKGQAGRKRHILVDAAGLVLLLMSTLPNCMIGLIPRLTQVRPAVTSAGLGQAMIHVAMSRVMPLHLAACLAFLAVHQ